jgi:hypothetical protein
MTKQAKTLTPEQIEANAKIIKEFFATPDDDITHEQLAAVIETGSIVGIRNATEAEMAETIAKLSKIKLPDDVEINDEFDLSVEKTVVS